MSHLFMKLPCRIRLFAYNFCYIPYKSLGFSIEILIPVSFVYAYLVIITILLLLTAEWVLGLLKMSSSLHVLMGHVNHDFAFFHLALFDNRKRWQIAVESEESTNDATIDIITGALLISATTVRFVCTNWRCLDSQKWNNIICRRHAKRRPCQNKGLNLVLKVGGHITFLD